MPQIYKIIIAVVITAIISGGGVYFWQQNKYAGNKQQHNIIYTSSTYGFSLNFPQTWAGYIAKNRMLSWGNFGNSDSVDFGFTAQDSLFNISIFGKEQWAKIQLVEGPKPTYLGENGQYVFGYETAQDAVNDTIVARMKDVKDIVKTFEFVK